MSNTAQSERKTYPRSLKGKVALVVGGAGAIGAATSRMLAAAGATIIVTHMDTERDTQAAKTLIAELGAPHAAYIANVIDTASLVAFRAVLEKEHGRLDILVNAAGFTKPVPH